MIISSTSLALPISSTYFVNVETSISSRPLKSPKTSYVLSSYLSHRRQNIYIVNCFSGLTLNLTYKAVS